MDTVRLTVGQATIAFLKNQFVERDGAENRFFAGCFGIFGHGNVGGIGQALQENPKFWELIEAAKSSETGAATK